MNGLAKRTRTPAELAPWGEGLDAFFRDFWGETGPEGQGLLVPAIDVSEDAASIRVSAELPGIDRKDVNVEVKDGVLTIRAEKNVENEQRDRNALRIERRYGSFYRALALPETVDAGKIDATLRNGVLTVVIPRREESKARPVAVKE